MKTIVLFCGSIALFHFASAQNVGIGIPAPVHKLHVVNSTNSINTIHATNNGATNGTSWDVSGNFSAVHGEGAPGTAQFQAGVYGYQLGTGNNSGAVVGAYNVSTWGALAYSDVAGTRWGVYTPATLYTGGNSYTGGNMGIGKLAPTAKLEISHTSSLTNPQALLYETNAGGFSRLNFQNASGNTFWAVSALNSATNANERLNFYNSFTGDIMSISGNGRVGIGTTIPAYTFDVTSTMARTGNFLNTAANINNYGVYSSCRISANFGYGVYGVGGSTGVFGQANLPGTGQRYGLQGSAAFGDANYGVYGTAVSGTFSYGVYGVAQVATNTNYGVFGVADGWAGYFDGPTFCSAGVWSGSDRKLKNDIRPLTGALAIIDQLKPSVYTFKTSEYKQMHLPEGLQYGLIADELEHILPTAVRKAVQPPAYERNDEKNGKKISDEVEFNAVNYTEMIPILIGAVKEQQTTILDLKKQIEKLNVEIVNIKTDRKQ